MWEGGPRGAAVVLATLLATVALLATAASAGADSTLCSPGAGAGQCSNPQGVATDSETGRIFLADRNNNRIDVFEANGTFLFAFGWGVADGTTAALQKCTATCFKGIAGSGDGQFNLPRRVAVDNAPASASRHDVYVLDSENHRVQKFSPEGAYLGKVGKAGEGAGEIKDGRAQLATGPGGAVYVGDTLGTEALGFEPRIEKFDESLGFLEECDLPREERIFNGLAIGPLGEIYVAFGTTGVYKFAALPSCAEATSPFPLDPGLEVRSLATDAAGDLYVGQRVVRAKNTSSVRVVTKYGPSGERLRRYGFGTLAPAKPVPGIAPAIGGEAGVLASEENGSLKRLVEPPAGPLIASLEVPAPVGNVQSTLEAEIDPEGSPTSYQFEYLTQAAWVEAGESFAGATQTPEKPLTGSDDFEVHLATATVGCSEPLSEAEHPGETEIEAGKCLLPETEYRYRAIATSGGGTEKGNSPVEGTFTTEPAIELIEGFASEVGTDSARLTAEVNPLGFPATGWFEYVTQAHFDAEGFENATQVPAVGEGAGPLDFGTGKSPVSRSTVVELAPDTAYHLRARAINPTMEAAVKSEERVFRTFAPEAVEPCPANEAFRRGFSALLPDCRAYELVSPLDKEGGDVIAQLDGIGYRAVLDQAAASGEKLAYGSYRAFGDAKAAPRTSQYVAERTASGWQSHYALGPRGVLTEKAANATPSEARLYSADLCQGWVKTYAEPLLAPHALPGQMNLYRRTDSATDCGGGEESWEAITTAPLPAGIEFPGVSFELQGATEDGAAAIYAEQANLQTEGVQPPDTGGELALYYQPAGEGKPYFPCVLPSGTAIATSCAAGTSNESFGGIGRNSQLSGALSADGSRVFWSTWTSLEPGPGKIYVRENPAAPESAAKDGEGDCVPEAGKACTLAVSAKGEALQGTSSSQFWGADRAGAKAIYSTGGTLYELDVDGGTTTPIAAGVLGVAGQSEDLSRIYFGSTEALSAVPNSEGALPIAGKANLYLYEEGAGIAFVTTLNGGSVNRALGPQPTAHTARTTPDGLHLAFMSAAGPGSEEAEGVPAPTGYDNRDAISGEADAEVYLYDAGAEKLRCASCNPSGGRPVGEEQEFLAAKYWAAAWLPAWRSSLQAGRMLAEDGSRLYFEASDSLAPRDANGSADVYQWEEAGGVGCDEADPSYSAQNEGCVSPISSGQGSGDAEVLDVSPSGDDVFFTTVQSLLGEDYGLIDAYDARVGGGLPEAPGPAPGCEGESCQHPAAAPEFHSPASLGYEGPVNAEPKAKKCAKGKVRRHGRCVGKKQAKHRRRHGRAGRGRGSR